MEANHIINNLLRPIIKNNSPRKDSRGTRHITIPIRINDHHITYHHKISSQVTFVLINNYLRQLFHQQKDVVGAHRDLRRLRPASDVADSASPDLREGPRRLPADGDREIRVVAVGVCEDGLREVPRVHDGLNHLLGKAGLLGDLEIGAVLCRGEALELEEGGEQVEVLVGVGLDEGGEVAFQPGEDVLGGAGGGEGVVVDVEDLELEAADVVEFVNTFKTVVGENDGFDGGTVFDQTVVMLEGTDF